VIKILQYHSEKLFTHQRRTLSLNYFLVPVVIIAEILFLLNTGDITTLNGDIYIDIGTPSRINNSANIIASDMQAKNGVVHVIDEVLTPAKK